MGKRKRQSGGQVDSTCISGSATTYGFSSLSPNARETARTPPTRHVPVKVEQHVRSLKELLPNY